jgi:hypothetical protein
MEEIMATRNQTLVGVVLMSIAAAGTGWLAPLKAAAQAHPDSAAAGSAKAAVTGTLDAAEPVVFAGHASVSGRVIRDTTFNAPPVLELIVDLSGVTARGQRSGAAYQVEGHAILRRPLQPFEQVEVGVSFAPRGNPLGARSAVASFGVHYSAAKGITTTPVTIGPHPPAPT